MKQIIKTDKAPAPIGPYSQAVLVKDFLFLSGQIPVDPKTNEVLRGDVQQQAKLVMENLKNILEKAGFEFHHIVKTTIFLTDIHDFSIVNDVYGSYFTDAYPARETYAVSALPKGVNVEISAIATK